VFKGGKITSRKYALECGVATWSCAGAYPYAELDDILGVTKHLNGGYIGPGGCKKELGAS
jgi:hypothetical protein